MVITPVFPIQPEIRRNAMPDSIYKQITLIGSSDVSWDEAASNAILKAGESIKDFRVAEVAQKDVRLEEGGIITFRTKLNLSFKILDY